LGGGSATASMIWWEDGVNQIMYATAGGVLYSVSGVAQVLAPTNAVDNVPANNVQAAGSLTAKSAITGDINGDGIVDIFDAIKLSTAFGSTSTRPGWNPDADLNGDLRVDIFDAIILANNFNGHV
jgi:hypothetical protein